MSNKNSYSLTNNPNDETTDALNRNKMNTSEIKEDPKFPDGAIPLQLIETSIKPKNTNSRPITSDLVYLDNMEASKEPKSPQNFATNNLLMDKS